MPRAGRVVPELGHPEIREVSHGAYRIVYRVGADGIDIVHVFEGHRLLPDEVRSEPGRDPEGA